MFDTGSLLSTYNNYPVGGPAKMNNDYNDEMPDIRFDVLNSRGPESKSHKAIVKALNDLEIDMDTLSLFFAYDTSPVMQARVFDMMMHIIHAMADVAIDTDPNPADPNYNALMRARLIHEMMNGELK
jgi:hypothetical protein